MNQPIGAQQCLGRIDGRERNTADAVQGDILAREQQITDLREDRDLRKSDLLCILAISVHRTFLYAVKVAASQLARRVV